MHVHTAARAIVNLCVCCGVQTRRFFEGKVHWVGEPIAESADIGLSVFIISKDFLDVSEVTQLRCIRHSLT